MTNSVKVLADLQLRKLFPDEFMVPVAWFKSVSLQHGVHVVNYGHIYGKIDNKAWCALGLGYLMVADMACPLVPSQIQ